MPTTGAGQGRQPRQPTPPANCARPIDETESLRLRSTITDSGSVQTVLHADPAPPKRPKIPSGDDPGHGPRFRNGPGPRCLPRGMSIIRSDTPCRVLGWITRRARTAAPEVGPVLTTATQIRLPYPYGAFLLLSTLAPSRRGNFIDHALASPRWPLCHPPYRRDILEMLQ